ncbi:MAG: twin-arginine translocase subunit TatC [Spirochaetota bacterium]
MTYKRLAILGGLRMTLPIIIHEVRTFINPAPKKKRATNPGRSAFRRGLSFAEGAAFELPSICAVLGSLGMISNNFLEKTRRSAILTILVPHARANRAFTIDSENHERTEAAGKGEVGFPGMIRANQNISIIIYIFFSHR